jgi:release factor glutamine methyltransferase
MHVAEDATPLPPRTLEGALRQLIDQFRAAGLPDADIDARLLLSAVTGATRSELITQSHRRLTPAQERYLLELQQRRLAREPVSRILGYRDFYGLRFAISPAVLDPRADSETLIETVLAAVKTTAGQEHCWTILDLGTGSGCLLLTLLKLLPMSQGLGLDKSVAALAIAESNAKALDVAHRCKFVAADFSDAARLGAFDIVMSNPPYIHTATIAGLEPDVRLYDPLMALDGGQDGLDAYRTILDTPSVVSPGGLIALEIGVGDSAAITALMRAAGFDNVRVDRDLAGIERVLSARNLCKREPRHHGQRDHEQSLDHG